jgi:hypothetical protein
MDLVGCCMRCGVYFAGTGCPDCDHDTDSRYCDSDGNVTEEPEYLADDDTRSNGPRGHQRGGDMEGRMPY